MEDMRKTIENKSEKDNQPQRMQKSHS